MKRTVTYVRRYYKAYSVEVDLHESLTEDEIIDHLDNIQENWDRVADSNLEFEEGEILIN